MESALIVSYTVKSTALFTEMLSAASINEIVALNSCKEARRLLSERSFDLIVINSPLKDETGEKLSRAVATSGGSQVMLLVSSEHFDSISALCETDGVLTIAKPVNKTIFLAALKIARATHNKLVHMRKENNKLKQKIEDIRIVDRAKWILISYLNMSEKEAHRYIEKQAMDMRLTKRVIAEGILKTYEN